MSTKGQLPADAVAGRGHACSFSACSCAVAAAVAAAVTAAAAAAAVPLVADLPCCCCAHVRRDSNPAAFCIAVASVALQLVNGTHMTYDTYLLFFQHFAGSL